MLAYVEPLMFIQTQFDINKSKWLQLMETGLVVEACHLCSAEHGAEFVCMHNHDSKDFMNMEKLRDHSQENKSNRAMLLKST